VISRRHPSPTILLIFACTYNDEEKLFRISVNDSKRRLNIPASHWYQRANHEKQQGFIAGLELPGGISPALQGVVPGASYGHFIPSRDGVIPGTNSELIVNEGCPI